MPTVERVEQLVAMVESGEHAEAIAAFYTEDATMQENLDPPRAGRDLLVAHETNVLKGVKQVLSRCMRPVFINGDFAVIRWQFEFEKPDGRWLRMDELAHQHWRGDLIATERFYYDPKQLRPEVPNATATGNAG